MPRFSRGERVRLRSDPGRQGVITDGPMEQIGEYHYRVFFSASDCLWFPEDKLETAPTSLTSFASHRDFLRDLLLLKLRQPLSDNLYSYQASRTAFRVYQFKPVLKFLNSPEQRMLIADEVGMGKTIEAGIIYLELRARMDLDRVLIVCPSGLREKWRLELRSRFDEEFSVLDTNGFRRFIEDYHRFDGRVPLKAICSLEMLRREDLTSALADYHVNFDLVIIDEAHHLRNVSTLSHALGELLAEQSGALLLLTAIPLHTGNEDLFHLMQLINPGEFANFAEFEARIAPNEYVNSASRLVGAGQPSRALQELRRVERTALARAFLANPYYQETVAILSNRHQLARSDVVGVQRRLLELNTLSRVFNRTRKREVAEAATRTPYTVRVTFSPEERAFYEGVVDFVRWEVAWHGRIGNAPIFSVITHERQAASCIQASRERFKEALETSMLALKVEESNSDLTADEPGTLHLAEEGKRRIRQLLELCGALGERDTKFDKFWLALNAIWEQDPECKVLVFTFFRGTISYLERRLRSVGCCASVIHGGVPMPERQQAITDFRDNSKIRIMLSSEVGAEGLDFQFCGAVVNYDLPWNPMRVEQRIGRLDRFGQEHDRIIICNLVIEDTIETRIFVRLYERIRIFEAAIGDLEAILGEEIRQLSRDVFMARLTPEEEIHRAEAAAQRIERYRQEQEEFERRRLVLLGQDSLLEQEMESVRDSGRFVAPDEVRSLIEGFLEEAFPRVHFEQNDDPTYALIPDYDFVHAMAEYSRRDERRLRPRTRNFIQRLKPSVPVPVTFDAETARQRKLVEFVTVHHPLALIAMDYFRRSGTPTPPRTCIWARGSGEGMRDFAFFIYRLDIRCLVSQATLIPVLVDLRTGSVESSASAGFLAAVQQRCDLPPPPVSCEPSQFSLHQEQAHRFAAHLVRERQAEAQRRNDALIEARIASLEQSYGFRIANARQQMGAAENERIVRMRRAQIENLKASLSAKRSEIEARRDVTIGYELVASGLVRLIGDNGRETSVQARPASASTVSKGREPDEIPSAGANLSRSPRTSSIADIHAELREAVSQPQTAATGRSQKHPSDGSSTSVSSLGPRKRSLVNRLIDWLK